MAFDLKKEYKELYMPKTKPAIVNVPKINYIAVRGRGDPLIKKVAHISKRLVSYMPWHTR